MKENNPFRIKFKPKILSRKFQTLDINNHRTIGDVASKNSTLTRKNSNPIQSVNVLFDQLKKTEPFKNHIDKQESIFSIDTQKESNEESKLNSNVLNNQSSTLQTFKIECNAIASKQTVIS